MLLTPTSYSQQRTRAIRLVDAVTNVIDGYIAMWGTPEERDWYGTWFDREAPPEMGLDFLPFPLLWEHGMGECGKKPIGRVTNIFFDDVGIGFRGSLDPSSGCYSRAYKRVERGEMKTSSGTGDHVAEFDDAGRFVSWLLTELSLTDSPAEDRMPIVRLVRSRTAGGRNVLSVSEQAPLPVSVQHGVRSMENPNAPAGEASLEQMIQALIEEYGQEAVMALLQQQAPANPEGTASAPDGGAAPVAAPAPAPAAGGAIPSDVAAALQSAIAAHAGGRSRTSPILTPAPTQATIDQLVANSMRRQQQAAAPTGHQPVSPTGTQRQTPAQTHADIQVIDRWAGANVEAMATGYILMRRKTGGEKGNQLSEEYVKALAYKTAQEIERGDKASSDYQVVRSFPGYQQQGRAIRANEVMQSNLANFGDEWVFTLQGTKLWESIRAEASLYDKMSSMGMDEQEIPQGYESETIPLEGGDPTWYVAAGATAEAGTGLPTPTFSSSKFGTGQKVITVAKLSSAMYWQSEFQEDSIINVAQEAARKTRVTAAEQIEFILANGDTATAANTNINLIDDTPAAAPTKPSYTLLDGLLKLALVTNTANSLDANGVLNEQLFLALMQKLPKKARRDRTKLLFIVDSDVALAALNMPTVKTKDVFSAATIEEGELMRLWKVAIHESAFIELANSAGKVPAAGGTLGRVGLARPDQWASRWKRRIQTDVTYIPRSDTTEIVSHLRWGLGYRDNEASAVAYNVPVTIS